jgi:hypothetical protein
MMKEAIFWLALASAPAAATECIPVSDISSTQLQDDRNILFIMRDRSVYRNTLPASCVGLAMNSGGFTYVASPGVETICATETSIRLNSTGSVCQLGDFLQVKRRGR